MAVSVTKSGLSTGNYKKKGRLVITLKQLKAITASHKGQMIDCRECGRRVERVCSLFRKCSKCSS